MVRAAGGSVAGKAVALYVPEYSIYIGQVFFIWGTSQGASPVPLSNRRYSAGYYDIVDSVIAAAAAGASE